MPEIILRGVPDSGDCRELLDRVVKAVISVEELRLTADKVAVFIPADRLRAGDESPISVTISKLRCAEQRTPEVLNRLAAMVKLAVKSLFSNSHVEVSVDPLCHPAVQGYSSTEP